MLEIKDLRFGYSRRAPEVLRGVTLTLGKGEIGILLGRNGAGKSTLFKNLLGIEKPVSGSATLDGVPLLSLSARERAGYVAYVPQNVTFGGLTVFDTVLTGRISRFGLRAGETDMKAVSETLDEMGITQMKDRYADRLSGGEKQKVAIARAIVGEPRLVIFDEPSGNLDLANERLLIDETRKLARERGISVLCALHDLNEAAGLGDRFFFMKDGVIRCAGGTECFTEEIIRDIYGIDITISRLDGRTVIMGK